MYAIALTVPRSVMTSTCRSTYPLLRPSARSSAGFSTALNSKSTPQTISSIRPVALASHFPEPSRLRFCHLRTCPCRRPVPIATADGTRSRSRAVSMLEPYANVQMRALIGSVDLLANAQLQARAASGASIRKPLFGGNPICMCSASVGFHPPLGHWPIPSSTWLRPNIHLIAVLYQVYPLDLDFRLMSPHYRPNLLVWTQVSAPLRDGPGPLDFAPHDASAGALTLICE